MMMNNNNNGREKFYTVFEKQKQIVSLYTFVTVFLCKCIISVS